jgi:hypothetical protein
MNFKLIEVEINEKDFPDQFEILEILNINTGNQGIYFFNLKDTKTNEYKLAIKLKKKYRVSDNAVYVL